MQSSSSQPLSAAPSGPSTSSTSTRNSKLDQIIQNFYTKTAQIIVQARCTPNDDSWYGKRNSLKGSSSSSRKMNKWFNIATEDVEVMREDLKYWRTTAVQSTDKKETPPMIIDIYLDTSKLSHNQSLVVADDNLRWGCVELKSQTLDAHIDRILIESWELNLKHPFPDYAVDLPNLYKRSIVFFRALHSYVRLLPTYDLYRKLHKVNDSNPLSIGYRLSSSFVQHNAEISLGSTILENDARKPTKTYEFSDIVTPIGTFKLNVTYRHNCDFRVEDSERDLSAQFIDMDEQFFTPTMAKYQQEYGGINSSRPRPVSMYSPRDNKVETATQQKQPRQRQQTDDFSPSTSPRHPSDPREIRPHTPIRQQLASSPANNSYSSNRNESTSITAMPTSSAPTRRASAPFAISPFKSPFLSSSPQAESILLGAGSGSRHYTPPSSDRSKPGVDSGSFGRKIEFSSSFDKYKASPTNNRNAADSPTSGASMMRRWSRASDHSSINLKNENDDDLEDFVRFVGSNQELRLFQNRNNSTQLLSSGHNLSSGSDTTNSSITGSMLANKKAALSHFQNLRETHNSLSESLSSSMMIGASSSQHDPVSGISPVSSTSSTGRSYQPIIPSPLHAEQRSTSPVHIPRSFPQLRSLTGNQNALRIARLNQSSHNEEDAFASNDMSAYSTYPQDHHHQDMHMLRNAATTSNSNRTMGRASGTPQQRAQSPNSININSRNSRNYGGESSNSINEPHLYNLQRSRNIDGGSSLMQDISTTTDINSSGQGRTNSMMDDDDSLVFKMSELECEGPSTQQQQQQQQQQQKSPRLLQDNKSHPGNTMLFNNRYNTQVEDIFNNNNKSNNNNVTTANNRTSNSNEHFLELTPTPLSPPLLHRLQAISMSTVAEEEKSSMSASGSSNKSESSPKTSSANKPSQLHLDW